MLPLDVYVVASANPEDYTNRGRIITPLKDRFGAQIRTHYPRPSEQELAIVEQEYSRFPDTSDRVSVPDYMKEVIAEITQWARRSPDIDQRSGVSLRVSITNYETLLGSAFKRSIRHHEPASPRTSDLPSIVASPTGKIELESVEEGREVKVVEDLIKKAVLNVFGRHFIDGELDSLVEKFDDGLEVEAGSDIPSSAYVDLLQVLGDLREALRKITVDEDPAAIASAVEFVLEGLHLNRKLNRDAVESRYVYRK